MKSFPEINNRSYIGDFNSEGYDSVESEDFEPGFGAVVVTNPVNYIPPEMPPLNWTKTDQENYEYEMRREQEHNQQQMEFLKSHGIE